MNLWHYKRSGKIVAVIEITKGSRNKYELNKKTGKIRLTRVLSKKFHYPLNYGFIPRTLAQDNDPLDVIILGNKLKKGEIIEIIPIALLKLKDQNLTDDKILAIPAKSKKLRRYKDLKYISNNLLKELKEFFTYYKDYKKVKVSKWLNKKEAEKEIKKAKESYKGKF